MCTLDTLRRRHLRLSPTYTPTKYTSLQRTWWWMIIAYYFHIMHRNPLIFSCRGSVSARILWRRWESRSSRPNLSASRTYFSLRPGNIRKIVRCGMQSKTGRGRPLVTTLLKQRWISPSARKSHTRSDMDPINWWGFMRPSTTCPRPRRRTGWQSQNWLTLISISLLNYQNMSTIRRTSKSTWRHSRI